MSDEDGHIQIGLRDRSGLSEALLTVSDPALKLMALMDGESTCEDIRRRFAWQIGQRVPVDALLRLLETLVKAHFLEGPGFESYYEGRLRAYRSAGLRDMPHAGAMGIVDTSGEPFKKMLDGLPSAAPSRPVRGLVAPHLDFPRGEPCYVAAYGALRTRKKPSRVVVLGTNHFGRALSVVATISNFATPLGTTRVDSAFLEELEKECGNLRTYELDHLREHSIELQVLWLQHLFGPDNIEIVPILCPDPCGPTETAPADGKGVDLADFARTLGYLVGTDDRDTLIVAGADLSHVGAAFGDERTLDDAFLEEVRQRDTTLLHSLSLSDPAGFLRLAAQNGNATRVCSAGCIFVLVTALRGTTGTLLRYHQAVDEATQTCVTCAAMLFT